MNRLDGKVALISGAARGIGAETARLMAACRSRGRRRRYPAGTGKETVAEITAAGGKALVRAARRHQRKQLDRGRGAPPTKAYGGLDILVNNAGMFLGRDFEEATLEDWHKLVAINMTGVFLGTKLCAPALRDSGAKSKHGSAIVNLASIAGLVGSQLDPLYSMTKGGVTLFTKSTALAFARKGYRIRVNSIHPGVIDTDMGAQTFASRAGQLGSNDVEAARSTWR